MKIEFYGDDIIRLRMALACIGLSDVRTQMTCLHIDDGNIVATDGRRLVAFPAPNGWSENTAIRMMKEFIRSVKTTTHHVVFEHDYTTGEVVATVESIKGAVVVHTLETSEYKIYPAYKSLISAKPTEGDVPVNTCVDVDLLREFTSKVYKPLKYVRLVPVQADGSHIIMYRVYHNTKDPIIGDETIALIMPLADLSNKGAK